MLCNSCRSGFRAYEASRVEIIKGQPKLIWKVALCSDCLTKRVGEKIASRNQEALLV